MKKWLFIAALALAAVVVQAEVKTVPGPVLDWYKDMMDVMVALKTDMDAVTAAPAASAAFDKASAAIKAKNLAPRLHQLRTQYPDFFNGTGTNGKTFVPPPGLEKTMADYSQSMMGFSQSMQKIMPYAQDPAVVKSMQTFQMTMKEVSADN
jgi:hypothetical protein